VGEVQTAMYDWFIASAGQLEQLFELLTEGKLSTSLHARVGALITQELANRDVLLGLNENRVNNVTNFE